MRREKTTTRVSSKRLEDDEVTVVMFFSFEAPLDRSSLDFLRTVGLNLRLCSACRWPRFRTYPVSHFPAALCPRSTSPPLFRPSARLRPRSRPSPPPRTRWRTRCVTSLTLERCDNPVPRRNLTLVLVLSSQGAAESLHASLRTFYIFIPDCQSYCFQSCFILPLGKQTLLSIIKLQEYSKVIN